MRCLCPRCCSVVTSCFLMESMCFCYYDEVFVVWLIVFVSGWVVFCWRWAVVLDVLGVVVTSCVNGTSPVGFVLSLFYLCVFQMKPVCMWFHLIEVCCLFICDKGHKSR